MHEVSICQSIINAVENEFPEEQLTAIREIYVKIGLLSCVEPEILRHVYSFMIKDTALQQSNLQIESVGVVAGCESCGKNFSVKDYVFVCPDCGTPSAQILEGNELHIHQIILEEFSHEEIKQ